MAISESTNPQLRIMLSTKLNTAIAEHHRLSDIAMKYAAHDDPLQQLIGDYQDSKSAVPPQE
jgi:spore coat protein CotF